jgi:hypothetical protein
LRDTTGLADACPRAGHEGQKVRQVSTSGSRVGIGEGQQGRSLFLCERTPVVALAFLLGRGDAAD